MADRLPNVRPPINSSGEVGGPQNISRAEVLTPSQQVIVRSMGDESPYNQRWAANSFLELLTRSKESTSQESAFLQENLSQAVSIAFQTEEGAKKLYDVIHHAYSSYTKAWPLDRKVVLAEIFTQMNTRLPAEGALNTQAEDSTEHKIKTRLIRQLKSGLIDGSPNQQFMQDIVDIVQVGVMRNFYYEKGVNGMRMHRLEHIYLQKSPLQVETGNILQILLLEHQRPGICSRLQKKYGINGLSRYPEELLVELDKTEEEQYITRRVLCIVAANDHNGAFSHESAFAQFMKLKKYNIAPLIFEIDSAHKLKELVEALPLEIKQSVFQAILTAHGTPAAINLSYGLDASEITEKNIEMFRKILQNFPNLEELVLDSCSTGKTREGDTTIVPIAQHIRDALRTVDVAALPKDGTTFLRAGKNGMWHWPLKVVAHGHLLMPMRRRVFQALEKRRK